MKVGEDREFLTFENIFVCRIHIATEILDHQEKELVKNYSSQALKYSLLSILILVAQIVFGVIMSIQRWNFGEILGLFFLLTIALAGVGFMNSITAMRRKENGYKKYIALSTRI